MVPCSVWNRFPCWSVAKNGMRNRAAAVTISATDHLGRGKRVQLGQGDRQGQAAHAAGYGLQPEPATVGADAIVADRIADRVVTRGKQMQHDQRDRLDRGSQGRDNAEGFHHWILPGLAPGRSRSAPESSPGSWELNSSAVCTVSSWTPRRSPRSATTVATAMITAMA